MALDHYKSILGGYYEVYIMSSDFTWSPKHDPTTIELNEVITKFTVEPESNGRRADFHFGKFYVNLDLTKSCCEVYELFINGYKYNKEKNFSIKPSTSVLFTFDEKTYRSGTHIKNTLQIKFSGGDRIRVNRTQWCNAKPFGYAAIYTRCVYLMKEGDDDSFELLGLV